MGVVPGLGKMLPTCPQTRVLPYFVTVILSPRVCPCLPIPIFPRSLSPPRQILPNSTLMVIFLIHERFFES